MINPYLFAAIILTLIFLATVVLPKVMEEHLKNKLVVKSLGIYNHNGKEYDLSHYFVDRNNNLYSTNPWTWETDPKRGGLLKCADTSLDKQGNIVNSVRSNHSTKVTLRRKNIEFHKLKKTVLVFHVNPRQDGRHFDVTNKQDLALRGLVC